MRKAVTRRRPRTQARLLEAALRVFADRGLYAATIEDICNEAGFTRGAFYSNFRTKDELFVALFDHHGQRLIERMEALVDEAEAAEAVDRVLAYLSDPDEYERRWFLVSSEFTLYAIRNRQAAEVLAEHDRLLREALVRLLEKVFARLGRRPTADLDELARLLVAIAEGATAQSYVEPVALPHGRLHRTFIPGLLHAFSTPASDAEPLPAQPGRSG
ncbi:TetR/AcrR family transcriptional regulator [Allostreptomyces psammosilenae]|uniref:AcrR family transcriptional regulator n=1 Tax=Allostreptomyces psammosilenae TaxID=1892865 RepID=A0A852ZN83_9ACTN|nr:TetR/AcrR family transcriptional regulator [Allostreptomyces psammosilenae]NYI03906.1 AcrR family transcriptional regulator [Allostreptomyces psammosilenae]